MRFAPPFEVVAARGGFWRAGVLTLAAIVVGVTALWWLGHPAPVPGWVGVCAALGMAWAAAAIAPFLRRPESRLRFERGEWHLRLGEGPSQVGALMVALDLGRWMLLRFVPPSGAAHWIPVQRRGLEPQWHLLRCAVHARRRGGPDAGTMPDG